MNTQVKAVIYSGILNLMGPISPTTRSFLNRISTSKQKSQLTLLWLALLPIGRYVPTIQYIFPN